MGTQEMLDNLSIVIIWFIGIATDVMMLFLEMPLVIFTAAAVVGMAFALVRKFFRAKK
ncbi:MULTISPECIES: hypothetical protein [Methanolobus]|uniref:Uncharacterized protein n=1 Tax=Methanolobus profundi TaxID=487685 RepID=A0A1I4UNZ0_9EURY|nr:hypothetical protein [Methanolobus profundi]SFM90704.1 hypothetical protein SAMN04488696_2818 [Methanolobus profundi]